MNAFILVVCALFGFWLVSRFLDKSGPKESKTQPRDESPSGPEPDPVGDACRILDLARPFTAQQLRAAYRRRISQYHPDKVSALGPEFMAIAEQKTKEINVAFETLAHYVQ